MDGITESNRKTLTELKGRKRLLANPNSLFEKPAVISGTAPTINQDQSSSSKKDDPLKRKEQLRIGKLIFEFNKEAPALIEEKAPVAKRKKGRPQVPKNLQAKNVTISLSKEEIDLLDNLESLGKGRGSRVVSLMKYYAKHEKRQKEQAKAIKEALRVVSGHVEGLSRNVSRAEKFLENEESIKSLNRSIDNLRIVQNLLKFDPTDLKELLTSEEFRTYEFALSFASNRKGGE